MLTVVMVVGLNVAGESGQGNSRSGGRVFNPGDQINYPGYPRNFGVRAMTQMWTRS